MESFYDISDLFRPAPSGRAFAWVIDAGFGQFWYETRLATDVFVAVLQHSPGSPERQQNRNDPEALAHGPQPSIG